MCRPVKKNFLLAAFAVTALFSPAKIRAETLAVVTHIHTTTSGGDYSPDELAGMLASQGIDAGIITDHDHLEIQWGPPPFRNLLHYTYRRPSIATEGADRYAAAIREAASRYRGLILIPGVESNPYYRIEIDWFARRLRVYNLHEHILALGLPDPDLVTVPSIATGFRSSAERRAVIFGLALAVAVLVLALLRRRAPELRVLRTRRRPRSVAFILLVVVAAAAAFDALAMSTKRFTQYGPDAGALPYQFFIDWVAARGGLTFWSHPGVNETLRWGPFEVITRPYFQHLAETDGYTGLDGVAQARAGGLWDELLGQYCSGQRREPPWLLAQADFKIGGPDRLTSRVNYVSVSDRSERGLIEALRLGHFYATVSGLGRKWRMEELRASNGSKVAGSGDTIESAVPVTVVARFRKLTKEAPALDVEIVRHGESVAAAHLTDSGEVRFDGPVPRGKTYYRVTAGTSLRIQLVANPVFVAYSSRSAP